MKKLFRVLAAVMVLAVVGGASAWALNWEDHVKIAPNGKGDALIYPMYIALDGGWETKLWLVNTAVDRSVVAKIVFNSMKNTDELLDFLIYLSPTDVWTGVIRYANGCVQVYSTDDSALAAEGVWATAANPLQQCLAAPQCANDTNMIGYVEVFEAAHSDAAGTGTTATVNLNIPPVTKQNVFNAYWGGVMPYDGINVLSGHMEFRNKSINQNSTVEATVLRDYDTTLFGQNPLDVVNLTFFGNVDANNTIGEVEAALSRNELAMPYSSKNLTLHFLTFPTKYTIVDADCDYVGAVGPFFTQNATASGTIQYRGTDYDLSENSKVVTNIFSPAPGPNSLPNEVNFASNFSYAEGWTRYFFGPTETTEYNTNFVLRAAGLAGTYTGAPVIGTVLNLSSENDGYYMFSGSYSDGYVIRTDAANPVNAAADYIYYYYQYQDESNRNAGPAIGDDYGVDMPAAESQARTAADGNRPQN